MNEAMMVFDRRALRQRRDRATRRFAEHDFLFREVADRLVDRLNDVRRTFPMALELGCREEKLQSLIGERAGADLLVQADLSRRALTAAGRARVVSDEEYIPFGSASFDLIISLLCLHWVNDLPGTLTQLRYTLKPDGLLLAAMFGGYTLRELRQVLAEAEIELEGGLSPRVSPFADVRDTGNLLQRTGFALPIADAETITVMYESPWALLADLRGMGETNLVMQRRRQFTRRRTLFTAMERYQSLFGDADGRVPATFQIIFLSGWAPHASQQQPLRRGSAKASLAAALEMADLVSGDQTSRQ